MAAVVDFYAPSNAAVAGVGGGYPNGSGGAVAAVVPDFYCNACNEAFQTAEGMRAHCKMERHVYNTKRRLAGLKPISQEAWERKLREARSVEGANKGTSHLKSGKDRKTSSDAGNSSHTSPAVAGQAASEPVQSSESAADAPKEEVEPFSPLRCLFDRKKFATVEENLAYMWKTYNFCIPDREYCTNLEGLMEFLWVKTKEPPHGCIYCNKKFADAGSCLRHMIDLKHTRIGTVAKTRTGGNDELGSQEMEAEVEEFFDFTGSTREVTEKIRSKGEKVGCLLRFFDADRDGRLSHSEMSALWVAGGAAAELSEAGYVGACGKAGANPQEGLDEDELAALYSQGLADLDAHFRVLQDLLAKKLSNRTKDRKAIAEEEEEGEEGAENGDKVEGGLDENVEVIECDDMDEFEEVMRVLGLQAVTFLENGDLRLPNGSSAVHRDVSHIWKQRGTRPTQLALSGSNRGGKKAMNMMLGNAPAGTTIAISHRAQAREQKKYVAVLQMRQKKDMQLGVSQNVLQKRPTKIRTGMGDASGGR